MLDVRFRHRLSLAVFALGSLAAESAAQSSSVELKLQQVDNPLHYQDSTVEGWNSQFRQPGGLTWDGLVRVQPMTLRDPALTSGQERNSMGYCAMVVRYGDFIRGFPFPPDEVVFRHSNTVESGEPFAPFQHDSGGNVWVDDRVLFERQDSSFPPVRKELLTDYEMFEFKSGVTFRAMIHPDTGIDIPRIVSMAPDPLDLDGVTPLSENPFPSNAAGEPAADGALQYMTYRFVMLTGLAEHAIAGTPSTSRGMLGTRRGYIVVQMTEEPGEMKRYPEKVVLARFVEPMQPMLIDATDLPLYGWDSDGSGGFEYAPHLMGIEPSWTLDRNLVVWFGDVENRRQLVDLPWCEQLPVCEPEWVSSAPGEILFSVRKPQPDGSSEWTAPRRLSRLHTEFGELVFGQMGTHLSGHGGTSSGLAGIEFGRKYKLAAKPLAHHDGTPLDVEEAGGPGGIALGEKVLGDYPWMLPDGELVTYQTTRGKDLILAGPPYVGAWSCDAWDAFGGRRGTQVSIGESTETNGLYLSRINDFPNNGFVFLHPTTNSTSNGRFDDAWAHQNFLPSSQWKFDGIRPERGAIGIYGSPSVYHSESDEHHQKWSEVSFRDYEDGEHLVYSSLYPLPVLQDFDDPCNPPYFAPDYVFDWQKAQDSSGFGNPILLSGDAMYPWLYYESHDGGSTSDLRRDSQVGKSGQGVFLLASGRITVPAIGNSSVYDFDDEATVELFLKPKSVPSGGSGVRLVDSSSFRLELRTGIDSSLELRATLYTGTALPATQATAWVATDMQLDQWSHIAASFQVGVGGQNASITRIFVDGVEELLRNGTGTQFYRGGALGPKCLVFGPAGSASQCTLVIDEIALSRVARTEEELAISSLQRVDPMIDDETYGRSAPLPLGITEGDLYIEGSFQKWNAARIELGRYLFFDTRLSKEGTNRSCASCHVPALGYSDGLAFPTDVDGYALPHRTPNLVNLAVSGTDARFRWDGEETTLEAQVIRPFFDSEMDLDDLDQLQDRLQEHWDTDYKDLFTGAYGPLVNDKDDVTELHLQRALAAFVRNLIAGNSRFDRFQAGANTNGLTEDQRKGWSLFRGKARCLACHNGASFSDGEFYNTRVEVDAPDADQLRFDVSGRERDRGAAKVPGLRDLALQSYFMHAGTQGQTLASIVQDYNHGGPSGADVHRKVRPLGLTDQEVAYLVEFLEDGLRSEGGGTYDPYAETTPW